MEFVAAWFKNYWQFSYLLYSALACVIILLLISRFEKGKGEAQRLAKMWGSIGFALLLFYLVGAADSRAQFLTFFGFGAMGTALGYLMGVWLSPSSLSEEGRFAKAQNLIATLFAGAFGTKLLSLWDDLTKGDGDKKLIYQPPFFLPVLCCLVGFFIALAAFYTLRSFSSGRVKITAPLTQFVPWLDTNQKSHGNGVVAATSIQFSGAADFDDDLSVSWELKPKDKQTSSVQLPAATISPTGLLTVPPAAWINSNRGALDWCIVATCNRDRSKFATFDIHFVDPNATAPTAKQ